MKLPPVSFRLPDLGNSAYAVPSASSPSPQPKGNIHWPVIGFLPSSRSEDSHVQCFQQASVSSNPEAKQCKTLQGFVSAFLRSNPLATLMAQICVSNLLRSLLAGYKHKQVAL